MSRLSPHCLNVNSVLWWADEEETSEHGTRPFGQPLCLRAEATVDGKPPTIKRGATPGPRDKEGTSAGSGGGGTRRRK